MEYQKGAFVVVPNIHAMRDLSLGARAVFVEVCVYADEEGRCFPSRKTLADNIKMSVDSVDRFITELVEAGFLSKTTRQRTDGSMTSNMYQIRLKTGGSRTRTEGGMGTHATAELYPLRTIDSEKDFSPLLVVQEQEVKQKEKKAADPDWPLFLKARASLSSEAGFEIRTGAWDFKNLKKAREFLGSPQMVLGLISDMVDNGTAHKLGYSISRILSASNLNRYKAENA